MASRAKANITIVTAANGSTWLMTTRLRRSIRRSLAGDQPGDRASRFTARLLDDLAGDDLDDPVGERAGALELVAGDDHRRADAAAWRSTASSSSRPAASSPAWGSSSSHSSARRATRHASAVRRRWPADSLRTGTSREPSADSEPFDRRVDLVGRGADGRTPEPDVLGDGEVGVQTVAVAEQADPRPDRLALGGEVEPEHPAAPRRAATARRTAAADVVLPAPFGPLQQHDLAGVDRERGARPAPGSGRARRPRRRVRPRCVGSRPWPAGATLRHASRTSVGHTPLEQVGPDRGASR